jgi:hypothetical protein
MTTLLDEQWTSYGTSFPAMSAPSASRFGCEARQAEDRDSEWRRIIRKVYRMLALRDDWDGLGAKAPLVAIVIHAIRLAEGKLRTRDYPAPTRVVATPAGTIGFEWQQGAIYTEAEVVGPDQSEWMQLVPGFAPKHWTEREMEEPEQAVSTMNAQSLPHVYWAISA